MYDSFIEQLAGLDLSGFSIKPAPFDQTDFPCDDAIDQTLTGVWSTSLRCSPIRHSRPMRRTSPGASSISSTAQLRANHPSSTARATKYEPCLRAPTAPKYIRATLRNRSDARRRPRPAWLRLNRCEKWRPPCTGKKWARPGGPCPVPVRAIPGPSHRPSSTPGTSCGHAPNGDAMPTHPKGHRSSLQGAVRPSHAPMEPRCSQMRSGRPSTRCVTGFPTCFWSMAVTARVPTGARAGFKRNEQMLDLKPRYVVAFAGNGVLERLVIEAKLRRVTIVDRRILPSATR